MGERENSIVQSVEMWDKERSGWGENLHDIKQKAWSMDPLVTSLIKTSAFIRRRALQYLYHEYFRVPGRSPDTELLQRRQSRSFFFNSDGQRKRVKVLHHTFLFQCRAWKSEKSLRITSECRHRQCWGKALQRSGCDEAIKICLIRCKYNVQ